MHFTLFLAWKWFSVPPMCVPMCYRRKTPDLGWGRPRCLPNTKQYDTILDLRKDQSSFSLQVPPPIFSPRADTQINRKQLTAILLFADSELILTLLMTYSLTRSKQKQRWTTPTTLWKGCWSSWSESKLLCYKLSLHKLQIKSRTGVQLEEVGDLNYFAHGLPRRPLCPLCC